MMGVSDQFSREKLAGVLAIAKLHTHGSSSRCFQNPSDASRAASSSIPIHRIDPSRAERSQAISHFSALPGQQPFDQLHLGGIAFSSRVFHAEEFRAVDF